MVKYTVNNLKKLENVLQEAGYVVRYEKGNFTPGYCILENRKVIVVNKYFETEARINTLVEITARLQIDENILSEASKETLETFHLQTEKN